MLPPRAAPQVPLSYLDRALDPDAFLPVPAAPAAALLLAECSFQTYEAPPAPPPPHDARPAPRHKGTVWVVWSRGGRG